jgi:PPP family 3-phenylpropionic acid transporter
MVLRMGITASSASVLGALLLAQALHAFTFATHHTVCIALLSHHFPGQTARARAGALHRDRLRLSGCDRRPGGRGFKLKIRPCQRVLGVNCYQSDSDGCAVKVWRLQHPAVSAPG